MKIASLGQKVAPPRFLLFVAVLIVGIPLLSVLLGPGQGTMAGFDLAAIVFLGILAPLLGSEADDMRQHARDNDANRAALLAISGVVTMVILVAVASELGGTRVHAAVVALIVATLVLAWLFSNTVYALHYAHLFYSADKQGKDSGGIDIPARDEPDYWDFLYFSFTLGMTFQTSDVTINSRAIRRVVLGHCMAAFVFNIGVLAFTINVLGG